MSCEGNVFGERREGKTLLSLLNREWEAAPRGVDRSGPTRRRQASRPAACRDPRCRRMRVLRQPASLRERGLGLYRRRRLCVDNAIEAEKLLNAYQWGFSASQQCGPYLTHQRGAPQRHTREKPVVSGFPSVALASAPRFCTFTTSEPSIGTSSLQFAVSAATRPAEWASPGRASKVRSGVPAS